MFFYMNISRYFRFCILKLIICIFLFRVVVNAQETYNKSGGICFRFDDNLPLEELKQAAAVFDKYKFKFCLSLNLAALPDTTDYLFFLRKLDANGFELMDHCPNHYTNAFWITPLYTYPNRPGVDHQHARMICLKYKEPDKNKFLSHGFVSVYSDTVISKKNGEFKNFNKTTQYLFFPSLNILVEPSVIKNQNSNNPDTMKIQSIWNEQLELDNEDNFEYYVVNGKDLRMTEDARALLAEESIKLFKKYNLHRPLTWIQPGSSKSAFTAQEIKETFGDRFHYTSAASDGGLQCYNDEDPYARFSMQWGDFSGGKDNVKADKNKIADQISKHYFLIGGSHFRDIPISWNSYLSRLDSILLWCQKKNIPVKTYREWAKLLYDTPQNPYTNIFPSLEKDLDENNIPDGYELVNGKLDKTDGPEKNKFSLVSQKKGIVCQINNLAGIEKGENEFFIWTKGTPGNFITVTIQSPISTDALSYKFPVQPAWTRYGLKQSLTSANLTIPSNSPFVKVVIECSDFKNGSVKVGDIMLNKKLDKPLYVISKPDTLISGNKKYEYNIVAAKYHINDKLSYKLVSSPSWMTINSTGTISGIASQFDGKLPVSVQIKDESGNTAMQNYFVEINKPKEIDFTTKIFYVFYFFFHYLTKLSV